MSAGRNKLQEALRSYTVDTLTYINTVRRFCEGFPKWKSEGESELKTLTSIKKKVDSISEWKESAFVENIKNKFTAESQRKKLERQLAAVLKYSVVKLEKLQDFLDAVEKLAVTSLQAFVEDDQVVFNLPEGVGLHHVQVVIAAAQLVCPLILQFKRDPNIFFLPKLQNVEVLAYQLDRYIQNTQSICRMLEKSAFSDFSLKMVKETAASFVDLSDDNIHMLLELTKQLGDISAIGDFSLKMIKKTAVSLSVDLSEENIQRKLSHTNQLRNIRMNQDFCLVCLFGNSPCSVFLDKFSDCQPRMLQCLTKLEEVAGQLDSMNKGAKISSVVGSSLGAIGGVLSIVGLALIPVTAGGSLGLTMAGLGLSVITGVNGAVTTATEVGVNNTQQKKADEVFQKLMEDVQSLQNILWEVSAQSVATVDASEIEIAVGVGKVLNKAGLIVRGIDSIVDSVSTTVKTEEVVASGAKAVAQGGKAVIGLNAVFLGMDIFFICKNSYSLYKGSETEVSQFIRARSTLWGSEIDAWKKIHDSLRKGQSTAEKNRKILDTPFYPEPEMEEEEEADMEIPSEEVVENTEEGGTSCVIR